MRRTALVTANVLIGIGLVGVVLAHTGHAESLTNRVAELLAPRIAAPTLGATAASSRDPGDLPAAGAANESSQAVTAGVTYRPVTSVRIPTIGLESEVVAAPAAVLPQGVSWDVPPFKVGHAEGTAGVGQRGNVVLFGHVSSLTLGNVFINLDRTQPGEIVFLGDGEQDYPYFIDEVIRVPRDDLSVIRQTVGATTTLITCIGEWLPRERDYAERLVVRARLI